MGLFQSKKPSSAGRAPTGLVTTAHDGTVAIVRINNAAHANVVTNKLIEDLTVAFESINSNDDVRAVVLAAEGMHFSAGPALSEMAAFTPSAAQNYWRAGRRLTDVIENARQPVVCAIQGSCLSVGLSIALACDFLLAAENARLAFPDIPHIQLVPGFGATQRLAHMIGSQAAKYLLITGTPLSAEDARKHGLVYDVVPADRLESEAREMATKLAASPLVPLEKVKHSVNSGIDVEYGTAMHIEERDWMDSWDVPGRVDIIKDAQHRLNAN